MKPNHRAAQLQKLDKPLTIAKCIARRQPRVTLEGSAAAAGIANQRQRVRDRCPGKGDDTVRAQRQVAVGDRAVRAVDITQIDIQGAVEGGIASQDQRAVRDGHRAVVRERAVNRRQRIGHQQAPAVADHDALAPESARAEHFQIDVVFRALGLIGLEVIDGGKRIRRGRAVEP